MNGMTIMRIVFSLYILAACLSVVWSGTHPDGVSKVSREQDALGNYEFSYAVSNTEGEQFRKEGTDPLGRVIGSYGLTHKDGTHRVVDYVADKDGFRAEIRSNEPGVVSSESADVSVIKLHPDLPLAVAATSIDNSGAAFGTRLKTDASRVSYVNQGEEKKLERLDDSAAESRQRNFDDYRPRSPIAYYPNRAIDTAKPLSAPEQVSAEVPDQSRVQNPSDETRPLDVYLPPIDPHTAFRRPPYYLPGRRTIDHSSYTSTSRRPFIPPYGGFDDDPLPVDRRPAVTMSTIHGGLGTENFRSPQSSTPAYGAGRYPSDDSPLSRDFIRPHFPPRSNYPSLPGSFFSSPPRSIPQRPLFGPPSYDRGLRPHNFVLRAVPIPNGIQAVRVDPETGRVYDRLVYPLFLRQNGSPAYDRNILLHNDDISDEDAVRNRNPGYLDIPFRRRSPFRSIRNQPFDIDEDFGNRTRAYNRTFDPLTLSIPTARDLANMQRQLQLVEGFNRVRFPNPSIYRNTNFENNDYPLFNDFDDSRVNQGSDEERYFPIQISDRTVSSPYSRTQRLIDSLTPEDTKEIASRAKDLESNAKGTETDTKLSSVEKE